MKLVLIPDKEDPDSYVNKVGVTAFNEFIAANKKDFILFQLEVMLKEAGNDVSKKSEVVNQVAETISKLNKAEDFTKQQDYIRQSAHLLKIDETGLTHLVNKLKRDKVAKDEKKQASDDLLAEQQLAARQPEDVLDDTQLLFNKDEAHERNVLRALLEHGLLAWDEEITNAEYVFNELDQFHFDNPLLEELFETYKKIFAEGLNPNTKTMLYQINDICSETILISKR